MSTSTGSGTSADGGGFAAGWMPRLYDGISALVWLPRGAGALREEVLDAAGVAAGTRVLELGCGTGAVTAAMLRRGARVTAVDRSPAMLRHARGRAPGAELVEADAAGYRAEQGFDVALFSFVLHELERGARVKALRAAAAALVPGGSVAVAEFAVPRGLRGRAWRRLVSSWEPPAAREVLDHGVGAELREAGLAVRAERPLAGGRARLVLAG